MTWYWWNCLNWDHTWGNPDCTESQSHIHTTETGVFPFYCPTFGGLGRKVISVSWFHWRWHHPSGRLWPITATFIVQLALFPSFHVPFIIALAGPPETQSGTCSHLKLNNSYKFKRREIGPLQIRHYGRNLVQTKCPQRPTLMSLGGKERCSRMHFHFLGCTFTELLHKWLTAGQSVLRCGWTAVLIIPCIMG